jgi:adenylosuccinate synthase
MQDAGDELDRRDGGAWVATEVSKLVQDLPNGAFVVVDAVRVRGQLAKLREAFGPRVVHVHLRAPKSELARRYRLRKSKVAELRRYAALSTNPTERSVDDLEATADVVIDTKLCSPDDVAVRAASHLGLYGRTYEPLVDVIIGGQYGSEGKGHVAAYLAREYDLLVRVGGPNAGHTVYEDPPYTHHLLPSGTRRCEASLLIGPGAVLDVDKLLREIAQCGVPVRRLSIDPQALIISTADKAWEMSRLRGTISSTGQGGGRATARRILRSGASPAVKLARDIKALRPYVRDTQAVLEQAYFRRERILLEGTQGSGLSLYHGHYPYVTSRDTTVSGCLAEAGIAPSRVRKVVMVCRTYPIRVAGPSGFMESEISWAEVGRRSGLQARRLQRLERTSTTNRRRRVAEFDWALLRKAASLNGPTDIALTFADYISHRNKNARRFEQLTQDTIRFVEEVERVTTSPVSLISTRFAWRSIIDRRSW